MTSLLELGGTDTNEYTLLYEQLLALAEQHPHVMLEDVQKRGVRCANFYDIAICFGLLDCLDDLDDVCMRVNSYMCGSSV